MAARARTGRVGRRHSSAFGQRSIGERTDEFGVIKRLIDVGEDRRVDRSVTTEGTGDEPSTHARRRLGHDASADCVVGGGAFDADTPSTRVRARIKVDGRVVATTTANELREDVRDAGYGDGFSGWSVNHFGRITALSWHVVLAEARDTTATGIWTALATPISR